MIMSHKSSFTFGLLLAGILATGAALAETSRPQTYVIGLDLSKSNPLVRDKAYAARAAARTAKEIAALPLKSRVMLRTFGSYDASANGLKIDQVISSHARPDAVAQGFEDSEYAHLTKSGGVLPAASSPAYQGCDELLILGLGQGGGSPAATKRLREAWAGYAGSAGFERFSGLYDW